MNTTLKKGAVVRADGHAPLMQVESGSVDRGFLCVWMSDETILDGVRVWKAARFNQCSLHSVSGEETL